MCNVHTDAKRASAHEKERKKEEKRSNETNEGISLNININQIFVFNLLTYLCGEISFLSHFFTRSLSETESR